MILDAAPLKQLARAPVHTQAVRKGMRPAPTKDRYQSLLGQLEATYGDYAGDLRFPDSLPEEALGYFSSDDDAISLGPQMLDDAYVSGQLRSLGPKYSNWFMSGRPLGVLAHEFGHALAFGDSPVQPLVNGIDPQTPTRNPQVIQWLDSLTPRSITGQNIGRHTSRYGMTGLDEFMGEAFSDAYVRGDRADPLSLAVREWMTR